MDSVYCKILQKRKSFLLDQLRWTRQFAKYLLVGNIITTEDLDEIEHSSDGRLRMCRLLAKLTTREAPNTFRNFCDVIERVGCEQVADMLRGDGKRIKWDFQSQKCQMTSVSDYVSFLYDQLMRRLLEERDAFARDAIIAELGKRLQRLAAFARDRSKQHHRFRQAILLASGSDRQLLGPGKTTALDDKRSFSTLARDDDTVEQGVLQEVKSRFVKTETEKEALAAESRRVQDELRLAQDEHVRTTANHSRQVDKLELLENVIEHQDKKLENIYEQQASCDKDVVRLSKQECQHMIELLARHANKWHIVLPVEPAATAADNGAHLCVSLQGYLDGSRTTIERFQQRIAEMSQRVTLLENERVRIAECCKVAYSESALDTSVKRSIEQTERASRELEHGLDEKERIVRALTDDNRALRDEVAALKRNSSRTPVTASRMHRKAVTTATTPKRSVGFMSRATTGTPTSRKR